MLEYTSRQVTQLLRQYEMFLKSLSIMTSSEDKDKIYNQMNKLLERIFEETNSIYEEEYMLLLGSSTYLINEEKERLLCLIKLIEDRIEYIKEKRNRHKELTGYSVSYPKVMGEDKLGEFKRNIKIIDKFNENKKKENSLSIEINDLDSKISEAVKKIKNNKNLNTTLEKKMINMLTKTFERLELYKLTDSKEEIESAYNELEFSLQKAKENVKKAKAEGKENLIIECDSLLSSITLEYEKVKEKKYTLRLMEIYDNVISDYEQLLNKREEMNDILNEISSSHLYNIVGEELNKQYNTIKIEKQDINTYETLVSERERKFSELEQITEENNSDEFREVLDELLVNERKKQEERLQEQRKQEYEERQRRLIEEKRLEDERRKRQQLIIEERKKEQETRTKKLLEQQRKTLIKKDNELEQKVSYNSISSSLPKEELPKEQIKKEEPKELPKENIVSFNSVLESDAIPIIKSNNLTPEKVGEDKAIKEKNEVKDIFLQEDLFPEIKIKE